VHLNRKGRQARKGIPASSQQWREKNRGADWLTLTQTVGRDG
jgi:hypothetical protein